VKLWDCVKAKKIFLTESTKVTESIDTFDKLPPCFAQQPSYAGFIDSFLCVSNSILLLLVA